MRNILFIKTSSLGDVVHQMPAMTDARLRYPDAKISWVVEEAFAPLARLHPGIDEVIEVSDRRWRGEILQASSWRERAAFKQRVASLDASIVIDTQGLIKSMRIARMSRGVKHGYDANSIRERLASYFYDVTHTVPRDQHAVTRNRALTALSFGYTLNAAIDYGLKKPSAAPAGKYAVLLHGTSRVTKEWREVDWIGLGKWLRAQGMDVILPWGNERERQRCVRLAVAISGAIILDRKPLDETAKVVAGASLVVGVDTGLLHLAAAYSVPLIAVFLATDPGLTGPVGNGPITVLGGKGQYPSFERAIEGAQALSI